MVRTCDRLPIRSRVGFFGQMRLRGLRRACFARLISTIDGTADPGRVFRLANVHVMLEIVSREALLNIRRRAGAQHH